MPRLLRAFLGNQEVSHVFAFNPQAVEWGIRENTQSFDTLGGRVVQLLSVAVDDMTINGQAGSRKELRSIAHDCKEIAIWQARHQVPVTLRVPSRGWNFQVYIRNMPRVGFEVTTVDYAYQVGLAIEESEGLKEPDLIGGSLKRIAKGVGFNTDWHGGDLDLIRRLYAGIQQTGSSADNQGVFDVGVPPPERVQDIPSNRVLSQTEVAKLVLYTPTFVKDWQDAARMNNAAILVALTTPESGRDPRQKNACCHGLWQINIDGPHGWDFTYECVHDAWCSAVAACGKVAQNGTDFGPWFNYTKVESNGKSYDWNRIHEGNPNLIEQALTAINLVIRTEMQH